MMMAFCHSLLYYNHNVLEQRCNTTYNYMFSNKIESNHKQSQAITSNHKRSKKMEHQSQAIPHDPQAIPHDPQAIPHAIIPDSLRLTRCPAKIWCRKCSTANEKGDSQCQTCSSQLHTLRYLAQLDVAEAIKDLKPFKDV